MTIDTLFGKRFYLLIILELNYNNYRPHQGINRIPNGNISENHEIIKKKSILGGLHHHYFRSSA